MGLTNRDKEIQQMLDANKVIKKEQAEEDQQAYERLYALLEEEEKHSIPGNFALRTAQMVIEKQIVKTSTKDFWFLGLSLMSFLAIVLLVLLTTVLLLNIEPISGWTQYLFYGFILLAGYVTIQILDFKIVRNKKEKGA